MGRSEFDPGANERRPRSRARNEAQQVWAIRFWLDRERRVRDRARFDLAVDSKLRGCDFVKIKIGEVVSGSQIRQRAIVVQQKTRRPVQFELRSSLLACLRDDVGRLMTMRSQAGLTTRPTCAPANMLD